MERGRKRARVLSSSESDSSPERVPSSPNRRNAHHERDMVQRNSPVSGYQSDGNSSVESMDIIMFPSASVLNKLQKSTEESGSRDSLKKNFKNIPEKPLEKEMNKSMVETPINKCVQKHPKNPSKLSKTSSKLKRKKEIRTKSGNNAYSDETKNKTSTTIPKENKNPNFLQTTNLENEKACKKPRLNQSVSNEKKKYLPNKYKDNNIATCSYYRESMPSIKKTKKSTVKTRPENYGSRLNPLLKDLESNIQVDNMRRSSDEEKQNTMKPKERWHIKYRKTEENSKTEMHAQNLKIVSYRNSLPIEKDKQTSPEILFSKDLNNGNKLSRTAKEGMRLTIENRNSASEFNETVSQLNASESLQGYSNQSDGFDRNMPSNHTLYTNKSDGLDRNMPLNYFLYLIQAIVHLDTKWIHEKEKIQKPPDELRITERKLPLFFQSFDDYFHLNFSMLKAEVWEKICLSAKSNLSHTRKNTFTFSIDFCEYILSPAGLMRLNCRSAVYVDPENSLVIVDLKLENGQIKSAFGIIEKIECKNEDLDESKKHQKSPAKQLFFQMIVKGRATVPKINCQMEGKFVCNLHKEIKQEEALHLMKCSPLLNDFLKPSRQTFCIDYNECNGDFLNVQHNIFDIVSREICHLPTKPKLMLLEGPPGSGKTSAIVTIASKLSRNKEDPKKILIVAPSHNALDEIGKQLLKQEEFFTSPISIVRLGQIENIHSNLLDYSLPKKLEKCRMSHKYDRSLNFYSKTRDGIPSRTPAYDKKSQNSTEQRKIMKNKEILNNQTEHYLIGEILSDTSIILAVPEDCWELYKFKVKFSCCLIDEVNQGTELDTLYPFALGINKFLLVADHMQLPANVESETARNLGFQRSVMERFQSYLMKEYIDPTIILCQQFRFNSVIADFPFNYIYPNFCCRERCLYAEHRSRFYPFKPYVLLDDHRPYGSYAKESGVDLIINLCTFIIDKDSTSSVGIIVASEEEQRRYKDAIASIPLSNVEVGTVDQFQGREKTVIILSCYHDFKKVVPMRSDYFSDVRKLNVALTRAISSLMICGPLHETLKYKMWSNIVTDSQNRGCYFKFESVYEISCYVDFLLY